MFSIPQTFRAKDSDYVTIPVLKKFCMENKIKVAQNRVDLLNNKPGVHSPSSTK